MENTNDRRMTVEEVEAELNRVRKIKKRNRNIRRLVLGMASASAIAILVAILFLPVLRIYGNSMTPTFTEGNIVVSVKGADFEKGDIISFYYNNSILVKRVIAFAGDWVDIEEDGTVLVNGVRIAEPYVQEKAKGLCDINLPYQVPDGCVFVVGDHRATSKDSRSKDIGPVDRTKIVGKIVYRVWPLGEIGAVH